MPEQYGLHVIEENEDGETVKYAILQTESSGEIRIRYEQFTAPTAAFYGLGLV